MHGIMTVPYRTGATRSKCFCAKAQKPTKAKATLKHTNAFLKSFLGEAELSCACHFKGLNHKKKKHGFQTWARAMQDLPVSVFQMLEQRAISCGIPRYSYRLFSRISAAFHQDSSRAHAVGLFLPERAERLSV